MCWKIFCPSKANHFLYLSGTPFHAIHSGEFIEEQIFNWTIQDEQRAKENWNKKDGANPYASLPRMVMFTYQLPETITKVAELGEFDGFDLNIFSKPKARQQSPFLKMMWKMVGFNSWFVSEQIVDTLKNVSKNHLCLIPMRLKSVLNYLQWF